MRGVLGGQPRHCICTNASRGLSATAEFLVDFRSEFYHAVRGVELYIFQFLHFCIVLQYIVYLELSRPTTAITNKQTITAC